MAAVGEWFKCDDFSSFAEFKHTLQEFQTGV